MANSVSAQTLELLSAALLGCGLGVLFDAVRVLRAYLPKTRILTAAADVLFWFVAVSALLAFILTVSGGRMRWYVLFGVFCGCFVYMSALSEIIYKVMLSSVKIIRKLLYVITRPIYWLLRFIWHTMKKCAGRAENSLRQSVRKRCLNKRKAGKNGDKKNKKEEKHIS
ncbi:MAG: spore cortex biosynthesis protein YabQ [Oscillospiraceae bacterium]|nr:spore cortex biosynthesis protein YabQ [Oscillospiraceae bacterium]